jgi:hypothetical protein
MCGRAYFKEVFVDPATTDWDSLEANFKRISLPRIAQIRGLARRVSLPWWHKFEWMSDEAKGLIDTGAKSGSAGSGKAVDAAGAADKY